MRYQVRTEKRPAAAGYDGTVVVLEDRAAAGSAVIWPAAGLNCFQWRTRWAGHDLDLLYHAPDFLQDVRPTRNGIPILFPFPNRIRDGRFSWEGQEYHLPRNDPANQNAIHGFACRRPWRLVDQGADDAGAWITGEFWATRDAPETRPLWPADYRLRVTYRLGAGSLRIEAVVDNPDQVPLPCGLGYHPYFRVPLVEGGAAADCSVEADARVYWELRDNLPTGARKPLPPERDLSRPQPFKDLQRDDLLQALDTAAEAEGGLWLRGRVRQRSANVEVRLLSSSAFRELVVFTPPHRHAVCLEPYTCPTDAMNLRRQGIETGLIVLEPGERWSGTVALVLGGEQSRAP